MLIGCCPESGLAASLGLIWQPKSVSAPRPIEFFSRQAIAAEDDAEAQEMSGLIANTYHGVVREGGAAPLRRRNSLIKFLALKGTLGQWVWNRVASTIIDIQTNRRVMS
jgi:hypothetical protein